MVANEFEKYGLALHTTSSELGLYISNFGDNFRQKTWNLGRDLSNYLHEYLQEFIQPQTWSDLEFIAVAKGPGSFTSTRIGVVTARTLAQQLNLPLFAISTLAAFAWSKKDLFIPNQLIAVEMEGRRNKVFVAIYEKYLHDSGLRSYLPETTITQESWQQKLNSLPREYKLIETPINLGTTVKSLWELAYLDWQQEKRPHWQEAIPFYGQHPVN